MEAPKKSIDRSPCDQCGECIRICRNSEVMAKDTDGFPVFVKDHKCVYCGHCMAVCPKRAISITPGGEIPEGEYFASSRDIRGQSAVDPILSLLFSLRSTRFFDGREVEKEKMDSILEAMVRAPSGGNEQNRNYYILHGKGKVDVLEADIQRHYLAFSSKLANPVVAKIAAKAMAKKDRSGLIMRNRTIADLPRKEREALYVSLYEDLAQRNKRGNSLYFFNSTAVVLVTSNTNVGDFHKPFHKADAEIAVTYGTIAAAALGLSSCRMGLAEMAFAANKNLREEYNIPGNERVDGVLALGYSGTKWMRIPPRGPVKTVWM